MSASNPAPAARTETADAVGAGLDPARHPVFFFDGECGLCDRSVAFLLARDHRSRLRFTPLQGETAAAVLPPENVRDLDSVVLWDGAGRHMRSTASIRGLAHLGWPWKVALVLLVIPAPLRDAAYRFVARNRIRWFGGAEACRLVTPEERARFLP